MKTTKRRFGRLAIITAAILLLFPLTVAAQFNYITNADNTIAISLYTGLGGNVAIPSNINSLIVTVVGGGAFENIVNLTSITIPNSITNIGTNAFYNCTNLTNVVIGTNVTSIGGGAFFLCGKVRNVIIPNSANSLGVNVFGDCVSLTNITIGTNVRSIGGGAFVFCSSLTNITIPDSVTNIGTNTFENCSNLAGITFGSGLTSISSFTFGNAGLASVTIPNNITNIVSAAFENCTNLTSVTIGSGTTNMGTNLTSIGSDAFENCIRLNNVTLGSAVKSIGSAAFIGCTSLTNFTVPNGVISIGSTAFYNCQSLTNVIVGNGVTTIGQQAFENCSGLVNFTVGNGVTNVGQQAFEGCSNLNSAYFQGNAPTSVGNAIFESDPVTVYVYQGATGWGATFGNAPVIVLGPLSTPPTITAQPQDLLVEANDTATFSVTATGSLPLSYLWSLNGSNISGATSSTLTITGVVQTNLGSYSVFVTNLFGASNSTSATLSMYPFLTIPFGGGLTYWGYTNILSVGAWGSGPLFYQWLDNGVAISSATNATLVFTNIQFTDAGLYTVVVSNAFGSVTNTPEQIVVNPAGVSLGFSPVVTISGVVGYSYIIQKSANLADSNSWINLTNLILTQPVQNYVDTNVDASSPFYSKYFYRVLPGQ